MNENMYIIMLIAGSNASALFSNPTFTRLIFHRILGQDTLHIKIFNLLTDSMILSVLKMTRTTRTHNDLKNQKTFLYISLLSYPRLERHSLASVKLLFYWGCE